MMILGSEAKLENDNRGVNVSRGLRARVEMGLWPGVAPLGYLNVYRTDRPCRIKVDPVRAPIIRRLFEKVALDHASVRNAYAWLKGEAGFRTRGGKDWALSGVYRALQNPFYYGRFEYPHKSGHWYKGKHQPIITKALFDAAQARIDRERSVRERHEFAFTRMIKCGLCGSGISAVEKFKPLKNGGVSRYVYYGCTRGRDRFCKARYITEENLMNELAGVIDRVDVDDLGTRIKLEEEVRRFNAFQETVFGRDPRQSPPAAVDVKAYAKYLLRDGSLSEKREILSQLRARLIYRDQKIYLQEEGAGHAAGKGVIPDEPKPSPTSVPVAGAKSREPAPSHDQGPIRNGDSSGRD
jgi:hypothetical protein